ncbi:MAG: hypothetical protein QF921_12085 [Pseudomonadales bacterium]|jgi:hypothetical protein|nr:hypothetical protein [Pseudomonadales bacterium]MDP6470897.1 hypothetical protein [Pseudomonadales bacterium]MDP6825918.1 hypothetical protein [Pseudomonadales bacterium]MDP6972230.1 hypothetical protein [Pseudomonadales bacterium]|tara:strand:- start:994 stop:1728 length:735 start_codon:yes stop_codon:yes gene_type:complete
MNRYSAFATHLGISLAIFAFLAYLVVYIWYPDFFFASDGGWQGIRIIVAVDLVLGPLLTLIVFKPGKPGLKMDLTLIALFQAACLMAGVYIVESERPVALVYVDGRFSSVSADTYRNAGVKIPDLSDIPGDYPKWVTVVLPEDPQEEAGIRALMFLTERPLNTAHEYYVPFDRWDPELHEHAYSLDEIRERDQETQVLPVWLAQHGGEASDYRYYPFGTRYSYAFLAMSKDTAMVDLLDVPGPP